uniref:beta-hexosaminidase-like n=1 Tax=Styela clava TaxID=7725 RepID=UPI00193AA648|nr:beta-hexosaminidase-like [Styela clava]
MLAGQDLLDYIGKNIKVIYEVVTNFGPVCKSRITLTNGGNQTIPEGKNDWTIYLYHMCQIASENIEIDTDHVIGGLFQLYPTDHFAGIKPGEKLQVSLSSDEPTVSRSSIFPNWYIASEGLESRVLESTADENLSFVESFDSSKKWKKGKLDKSNPFTPEERYDKYFVKDRGDAVKLVIPTPLICDLDNDNMINISQEWVIYVADNTDIFKNEVNLLAERLHLQESKIFKESHVICLKQGDVKNEYNSNEAYVIEIKSEGPIINITSKFPSGMFYAVQTLFSLLSKANDEENYSLPCGMMTDAPRFQYRGIHIDVARNFVRKEEILKMIKVMSMYKMNKLHFHLTDDEGWRLEIKDLPELTEIGAKRDHDLAKTGLAVEPTLGSGPKGDACSFYTVEDYQNILQYAKEHHVEVIPEIDMPGHSYAAVLSMAARYNKYREAGNMEAAKEFMLSDLSDNASYTSDQKYTNNTINPCLEGSRRFVEKIISSLKKLHEPIQPLKIFHVGGDEVPVGAWDGSSICQVYYKENNLDGNDPYIDETDEDYESVKMTSALQEYFLSYVEEICRKENLQLAVWNDGIRDPTVQQKSDCPKLVHAWRISRKNDKHNPNILANSGYQVVISSATHTYFDHPYEPDPEECGLHWCVRMLDTKTVFGMTPLDMYSCQDKRFKKFDHEKLLNRSSVLGVQSQIWGELLRSENMFEYMQFPRLLALAERAWHEAKWENGSNESKEEDWESFANTIGYKELRRLDKLDIHYRVPPPGIKIQNDKLLLASVYPGLKFKYRLNGDVNWTSLTSPQSVDTFKKGATYEFVTMSSDGKRLSRLITKKF